MRLTIIDSFWFLLNPTLISTHSSSFLCFPHLCHLTFCPSPWQTPLPTMAQPLFDRNHPTCYENCQCSACHCHWKGQGKTSPWCASEIYDLKHQGAIENIDSAPPPKKPQGGHSRGTANYSKEDIEALMDILEDDLPTGSIAWNTITAKYDTWVQINAQPGWAADSLEHKLKEVIWKPKLTGHTDCPTYVDHMYALYDLMDSKFCTIGIDNGEEGDCIKISDNSSDDSSTTHTKIFSNKRVIIKPLIVHSLPLCHAWVKMLGMSFCKPYQQHLTLRFRPLSQKRRAPSVCKPCKYSASQARSVMPSPPLKSSTLISPILSMNTMKLPTDLTRLRCWHTSMIPEVWPHDWLMKGPIITRRFHTRMGVLQQSMLGVMNLIMQVIHLALCKSHMIPSLARDKVASIIVLSASKDIPSCF